MPLHVMVTLPRSPPAMVVAVTSNSAPWAAEATDADVVSDFMVMTFTFVFVTDVSAVLSICTDWNLFVAPGLTDFMPENAAVVLAPAPMLVANPVPV